MSRSLLNINFILHCCAAAAATRENKQVKTWRHSSWSVYS